MESANIGEWVNEGDSFMLSRILLLILVVVDLLGGNGQRAQNALLCADDHFRVRTSVVDEVGGGARLLRQLADKVVLLVNLLLQNQKLVFFFRVCILIWRFNLEPLHLALLICHNEVLRGHYSANWLCVEVKSGANARVFGRNVEYLLLVGAKEHSTVRIPICAAELNHRALTLRFSRGNVFSREFFNFESKCVDKVVFSTFGELLLRALLPLNEFKGGQNLIEVDLGG